MKKFNICLILFLTFVFALNIVRAEDNINIENDELKNDLIEENNENIEGINQSNLIQVNDSVENTNIISMEDSVQTTNDVAIQPVVQITSNVETQSVTQPKAVKIVYQTHIQNIGWQGWKSNGQLSGTEGQSKRLEAIRINLEDSQYTGQIQYQTHVENIGWQGWKSNGQLGGTEGQSKRLEAIRIKLTDQLEQNYDIYYRVHVQNFGWLDWAKNGESAGSAGYGYRLEAINVVLVPKNGSAPGKTQKTYYEKMPSIRYQTHIKNIGWQGWKTDGQMSGTEGQSKRLEAINIILDNGVIGGNIIYQTHIQNIGWTGWSSNGNISGTSGQSKRLEAIKILLQGDVANSYDIYYRVHIENIGWTGWTSNGLPAGSEGYSYRLEAIQIKLIKKGETTPEFSDAFYLKPKFNWYYQNGVKHLSNNITGHIGSNVKKIIDISEHNNLINWNKVKNESDVDGVILRVGFGSYTEDKKFAYNVSELKRLGIPYGIYLFSYAENNAEALAEASFVLSEIQKYNLNPTLGIYYDIEGWRNYISPQAYDGIITTFITRLNQSGYSSSVYTYLNYALNNLSAQSRHYITWIAQYNNECQYTGSYKMWQYTSDGHVNGISTKVDENVMFP